MINKKRCLSIWVKMGKKSVVEGEGQTDCPWQLRRKSSSSLTVYVAKEPQMATLNVILLFHFGGPTHSSKMFRETIIFKRRKDRQARNKLGEKNNCKKKQLGERQRKEQDTKIIALEWRAEDKVGSLAQIWGMRIKSHAQTFPSLPSRVNMGRSYAPRKKPWCRAVCWPERFTADVLQASTTAWTTTCDSCPCTKHAFKAKQVLKKKSHICRNVAFVKHLDRKRTKLNSCSTQIVGLLPNKRTLTIALYTPICFSYTPFFSCRNLGLWNL